MFIIVDFSVIVIFFLLLFLFGVGGSAVTFTWIMEHTIWIKAILILFCATHFIANVRWRGLAKGAVSAIANTIVVGMFYAVVVSGLSEAEEWVKGSGGLIFAGIEFALQILLAYIPAGFLSGLFVVADMAWCIGAKTLAEKKACGAESSTIGPLLFLPFVLLFDLFLLTLNDRGIADIATLLML